MKIFSDFKFKDIEYLDRLTSPGDVVVMGPLKYICTDIGYVSEIGKLYSSLKYWNDNTVLIKREHGSGECLEELLTEGEKRCKYY